jgi:hypothetical protein
MNKSILEKDGMIGVFTVDEWNRIKLNIKQDELAYVPNGLACCGCVNIKNKCNHLEFDKMYVIERDKVNNLNVVRCDNFVRVDKND